MNFGSFCSVISFSFLHLLLWKVEQEEKVKNPLLGSAEIHLHRALNPVLQPWKGFHTVRGAHGGDNNYLILGVIIAIWMSWKIRGFCSPCTDLSGLKPIIKE